MNGDFTTFLMTLTLIAALVAAFIASAQKYTTLSKRTTVIATLILGAGVGVLAHLSGFLDTSAPDPMDIYLSGAWGLFAAFAGAGMTKLSLFTDLKKQ